MIAQYITAAFIGLLLIGTVMSVRRLSDKSSDERRVWINVVKNIRWWMFLTAAVQLTVVLVISGLLYQIPILQWGWWKALTGVQGNASFGQTSFGGPVWAVVGILLPVLLVIVIPNFAHLEEEWFRYGNEKMGHIRRFWTQLCFGGLHLLAGIPLSAAIALTASGYYFMWFYLRAHRNDSAAIERETANEPKIPKAKFPERPSFPDMADGYDAEAWTTHRARLDVYDAEFDKVIVDHKNDVEQWVTDHRDWHSRLRSIKERPLFVCSAAHTSYNWTVIALFGLFTVTNWLI